MLSKNIKARCPREGSSGQGKQGEEAVSVVPFLQGFPGFPQAVAGGDSEKQMLWEGMAWPQAASVSLQVSPRWRESRPS